MAIKTKDELFQMVRDRMGEDTSDEALAFVADFTDTVNDLETKAVGDGINWQQRYEENDKTWRQKYRDRFFEGSSGGNNGDNDDDDNDNNGGVEDKPLTFENLFEEV